MTIESALALSLAIILLTLKPGPGILAIISRGLSGGFLPAFVLTLGISTVHMLFYGFVVAGLSLLESHMTYISFLFKTLGAVYLIYIGIKGLNSLNSGVWQSPQGENLKEELKDSFLSGLAITLANPLTILFYSAIIPTIFPQETLTSQVIIGAAIVILVTQLSFISIGIIGVTKIRNLLKNPNIVRNINLSVNIIFILLGLYLGLSLLPGIGF